MFLFKIETDKKIFLGAADVVLSIKYVWNTDKDMILRS